MRDESPSPENDGPDSPGPVGGLSREAVVEALKTVLDPELGVDIVNLGLVYEVQVSGGHVDVKYSLTTMGCPIGPLIEAQMGAVLSALPGFADVDIEMVFSPAWSPEMMSEEAKAALGWF